MLLSQIRKKYRESLPALYPREEINSIFEIAVETFLKTDRLEMHRNMDKNTSPEAEKKMMETLDRLLTCEPIQYITGSTHFYDIPLTIRSGVLIPRQETEYLVEIMLKDFSDQHPLNIIDLCTGSGCIAIALAMHMPGTHVLATDISVSALELARENASTSKVTIEFVKDDILHPSHEYGKVDSIVSNPPYVRNAEKVRMHANVLQFEPPLALFVEDENPLLFYRAILQFAANHLKPGGTIYLEINEYLGNEMYQLVEKSGASNITILKDLNNKVRYLRCSY